MESASRISSGGHTWAGGPPGPGRGSRAPPLDLPHYHGIGVAVPAAGSPADHGAAQDGTVKEVTGA